MISKRKSLELTLNRCEMACDSLTSVLAMPEAVWLSKDTTDLLRRNLRRHKRNRTELRRLLKDLKK